MIRSPRSFKPLLYVFFTMILLLQCKKDKELTPDGENPITNEIVIAQNKRLEKVVTTVTSTAFLHGNVLDETGNPLSGVEVKSGGKTQTTDKDGYFVFGEIAVNKDFATVKAEKSGYMKGIRTFAPTGGAMNKVEIRLQSRGTAQNIEASNGGELAFDGGKVKLNFPAGSIADADGKAYTGTVKVYARYINPETAGFSSTMPGNLVGLTDDNRLSGMISYGMASVELTDNNGKLLQVAEGKSVKVTMPAIKDAPADMPVWHFNESYGLWVEAGKAVKSGAEYSFEANHFSTWNLDLKVEDAVDQVTITLKSSTNQNVANQKVDIYTSDFSNRLISVYTDNVGQFTLLRTPKNLGLRVITGCQDIDRTTNVTSENITITLPNLNGSAKIYEISGTVKDCDSNYTNMFFTLKGLTESNISFSGKTNAEGKFETNFILCNVNPATKYQVQVIVYTRSNTTKLDTVELIFNGSELQVDIDFCDVEEVINNPNLNPNLTYGSVTDIDGNKYPTIKIGTQIWMAENLKVSKYNDGTSIPNVTDSVSWFNLSTGAWCNLNNRAEYGTQYGKLYNWYAVESGKLCPKGWHMPDDAEWNQLTDFLGGDQIAGSKMRSVRGWSGNIVSTNESGFSAIAGGFRIDFAEIPGASLNSGGFMNGLGAWWSRTKFSDTRANNIGLVQYDNAVGKDDSKNISGLSCRCVED